MCKGFLLTLKVFKYISWVMRDQQNMIRAHVSYQQNMIHANMSDQQNMIHANMSDQQNMIHADISDWQNMNQANISDNSFTCPTHPRIILCISKTQIFLHDIHPNGNIGFISSENRLFSPNFTTNILEP